MLRSIAFHNTSILCKLSHVVTERPLVFKNVDDVLNDILSLLNAGGRNARKIALEFTVSTATRDLTILLSHLAASPRLCEKTLNVIGALLFYCEGTDPWSAEADACKRRFGSCGLCAVLSDILRFLATVSEKEIESMEYEENFHALLPKLLNKQRDPWYHVHSFLFDPAGHIASIFGSTVTVLFRLLEHNPDNVRAFVTSEGASLNLLAACHRHVHFTNHIGLGLQAISACIRNPSARGVMLTASTCDLVIRALIYPEFCFVKIRIGIPLLSDYVGLPAASPTSPPAERFHELVEMGVCRAFVQSLKLGVAVWCLAAIRDCVDQVGGWMGRPQLAADFAAGLVAAGLCEAVVEAREAWMARVGDMTQSAPVCDAIVHSLNTPHIRQETRSEIRQRFVALGQPASAFTQLFEGD
jgi:hypothetical protein